MTDAEKVSRALMLVEVYLDAVSSETITEAPLSGYALGWYQSQRAIEIRRLRDIQSALRGEK